MSLVNIIVHAVWGTKNRQPVLQERIRGVVLQHIKENAEQKGIYILAIGGHLDHIHVLISLGTNQNIAEVIALIKGECSYWVNRNKLIQPKLTWAADYFAASVSRSAVGKVTEYIRNQKTHHERVTFEEEYSAFIKAFQSTGK